MINPKGIIQNNRTASDFIRQQRKFNETYKILDKDEERRMIEGYARLKLDENGNPKWNGEFECDFEWIGDETELRLKLAMHNLKAVTRISTKHCQDTRDYDNMYAKGLYGLVRAANEFHPFKLITKKVTKTVKEPRLDTEGNQVFDENGNQVFTEKKIQVEEPKLDENGKVGFIKFNTFAQFWIFKYVMDEFYAKSIQLDNNSISINDVFGTKDMDGKSVTFENFLYKSLAPEVEPPKGAMDEISATENLDLYETIHEYIETTSDLSAMEKAVIENTFYGDGGFVTKEGNTNVKKLSSLLKIPQQDVMDCQISALEKLKDYLYEEYGIESLSDIM